MEFVKNAELFAKKKHSGMMKKDGMTTHSKHLEEVVNRLKSLGIIDKEILCAGWLHDSIEDTDVNFDDLLEKFGTKTAVIVLSLSKDKLLPKKLREKIYIKQLRETSMDAKIIKLCDISANLSSLKKYNVSKSKKRRIVRQIRNYLIAIKEDLIKNKDNYPQIIPLLESIDQTLNQFGQRTVLS